MPNVPVDVGNAEATGQRALDSAFREFEVSWGMRSDPVVLALVDAEKLAEMTQWLEDTKYDRIGQCSANTVVL